MSRIEHGRVCTPSPSLGSSMDGSLYRSYDNYLGDQGVNQPRNRSMSPQPGGRLEGPPLIIPMPLHSRPMSPAEMHQPMDYDLPMNYGPTPMHSRPMSPAEMHLPMNYDLPINYGPLVVLGLRSPFGSPPPMPLFGGVPMDLGSMHQVANPRSAPALAANAEIRGVGIKFGERVDPATGRIKVYVKRLVNDSPAHWCGLISPGDVLVHLDGEDVYGWGLAWLRNKIPGPAGTWVCLGFRGAGGGLFEVPLCRTAYGTEDAVYRKPQQQQPRWHAEPGKQPNMHDQQQAHMMRNAPPRPPGQSPQKSSATPIMPQQLPIPQPKAFQHKSEGLSNGLMPIRGTGEARPAMQQNHDQWRGFIEFSTQQQAFAAPPPAFRVQMPRGAPGPMMKLKEAQRGKAPLILSNFTSPHPPALQAHAPFKHQQPMQMPHWAPQHALHMPINSRTGQQLPAAWQIQTPPNMEPVQGFLPPKSSGVVGQDAIISTSDFERMGYRMDQGQAVANRNFGSASPYPSAPPTTGPFIPPAEILMYQPSTSTHNGPPIHQTIMAANSRQQWTLDDEELLGTQV